LSYLSEAVTNVAGGTSARVRESGQLSGGARLDMEELFDIPDGSLQAMLTWRRGENLAADAGLNTIELVQENYGRGKILRLTQLWYQQSFADRRIDVKLGRVSIAEDFATFPCDFMNLSFCGARPGSVVNEYWLNWPVSQWGMRWRYRGQETQAQIGAYEVNPKNLDEHFNIGRFSGATGVLVPIEGAFTRMLGDSQLPGTYKIGAWYDTSSAEDVFLDATGAPRAQTGLPALQRQGRYGAYVQIQQRLTGSESSGLRVFLNGVRAERRTSRVDSQIGIGLTWADPFQRGAPDQIGLALGRTHVNTRAAAHDRILQASNRSARSEYPAELYFRYAVTSWLTVQPSVQYVASPGGYDDREDVIVVGLRTALNFH
jgi:porin